MGKTPTETIGELDQSELVGVLSGPLLAFIESWGGAEISSWMIGLAAAYLGYRGAMGDSPAMIGMASAAGNWATRRYRAEEKVKEVTGVGGIQTLGDALAPALTPAPDPAASSQDDQLRAAMAEGERRAREERRAPEVPENLFSGYRPRGQVARALDSAPNVDFTIGRPRRDWRR